MNINSISVSNLYKTNLNKNQNVVSSNCKLASDCFVKSSNVSFSSLTGKQQRQQKVDSFMKDLVLRVNSPKFSISDVSNSMKKCVKNISVKPMSQAPKELLFSSSLQGLYCADLNFDEANNRFFYPQRNRNFYLRTETFNKPYGKLEVFVNAVHELTHALQTDDAEANQTALFNNYVAEHKDDVDSAVKQIEVAVLTINKIEESIARPFINTLVSNEDLSYDRLQRGQSDFVSWLCRKNRVEDFDAYIQEKVNQEVLKIEENSDIVVDKKLLLDTTLNHFEREIEAYQNENKAHKMLLGVENTRALTRIQLYQKSIDILKNMRKI